MPKDACYNKVVARYGPKTSAYRSGGLARSIMSDRYNMGKLKKKK